MDRKTSIHELKEKIKNFCTERDWDKHHNAKDLAICVITEASELLEHFRFKTEKEAEIMLNDPEKRREISEEMSDVLYCILRLAGRYDIDMATEFEKKMKKNAEKYPANKIRVISEKGDGN